MLNSTFSLERLHLNSIVAELDLIDAHIDIDMRLSEAKIILEKAQNIPGLIITSDGEFSAFISRKELFEILSKPFGLELFSKRPLRFLLESINPKNILILPSTMTIIEAAQKALEREEEYFDSPLIIEFDSGRLKLLNSYNLLLAHLHINSLALKALKEANELKTELLSVAAHDLKNPLSSIIGFSKIITNSIDDTTSDINEMNNMIHDSAKHMLLLINEILNASTIETGKMNFNKSYIDLSDIITALVYQNKALASAKNQNIIYNIKQNDNFCIYGDPIKIREACENLISNAIKYSPYSSNITIELYSKTKYIYFNVIDQGPGISSEDLNKIFGKFQRLSAQPTGGESSTGLGLYICKQIIEKHDGEICLESKINSGSKFTIQLPLIDINGIEELN